VRSISIRVYNSKTRRGQILSEVGNTGPQLPRKVNGKNSINSEHDRHCRFPKQKGRETDVKSKRVIHLIYNTAGLCLFSSHYSITQNMVVGKESFHLQHSLTQYVHEKEH
jgi:hypothetical protein